MGAVAMGAQAAGGGLGAYGAYKNGLAQRSYDNYVANNKRSAADAEIQQGDLQSKDIEDTAAIKTEQLRQSQAETEGSQSAEAGANGTAGSVTAADIATDTARKAQLDRMMVKYNADKASWAARTSASNRAYSLRQSALEDEVAGKEAAKAGKLGAATTLLSSAGQVANTWSNLKSSAPSRGASGGSSAVGGGRQFPIGSGAY